MSSLSLSAILTIVDEATRPLKMIRQYSDSTENSIDDLKHSLDRLNQTLGGSNTQRYSQSLKQTEKNSHAMRSATKMLVTEYGHVDHALTAVLNKTKQWDAQLKQSRQNMRAEFKTTAMGLVGIGYTASIPIKAFAEAEEASTKLKVSMMDSTGKVAPEFEKINQLATQLGARLPGSNADFQLMMANLVQQGISFKSILGGTGEAAGNLAVLLKMPFDEAATFAAKMQDATQTSEKDMLSLMDTIQRTAYLGVDPTNMLGGFAKLGAGMKMIKQAGLEGSKAMAPLLVMADQSGMTDLSSAGNALTKTFKAMLDQSKIDKALKGTKLKLNFSDGKGEFGGLDNMFKQLDQLKSLTTQQRNGIISDIFGNDAENMQILNLLIEKNKKGYDETIDKMNRQADLQTRINEQLGTLKNLWEQAEGAMTNVMVDLVTAIAPDLKVFVNRISEIAEKISAWAKANPELVRTIAKIAMQLIIFKVAMLGLKYTTNLFFGAIVGVIAGITKLAILMFVIRTVAGKLGIGLPSRFNLIAKSIQLVSRAITFLASRAIPLLLVGLRAMAVALLTNPLTWIIASIALVAFVIYKYWGPIKAFFKGFWDGIKMGLAPLIDTFRTAFNNLKSTLAPLQPVWDALVGAWTVFKGVLGEILSPMQASNQELQNATNYGQALGLFIGALIGIFTEAFMTIGRWLGETAAQIVIFVGLAMSAWESFKSGVMSIGASIVDFLLSPIRLVIDAVNTLTTGLNKIPFVNIPKIPQIPQLSTSAAANIVPTKTIQTQPIVPLRLPQAKTSVNHFAPAQIHISGVSDTQAVGALMDQKLKNWQQSVVSSQNRSYSDQD
ncbi:phage tail tape measure protein [Acinetobacter sp. 1207_04]|uniref:phage tail tape measure protein n=1 Tax=Acinetobacter sp. 1207_04 TaxID=2604449 RepID=UPI004059E92D